MEAKAIRRFQRDAQVRIRPADQSLGMLLYLREQCSYKRRSQRKNPMLIEANAAWVLRAMPKS